MPNDLPATVCRDCGTTGFAVLAYLRTRANGNDAGECWPSQQTIGDALGLSRRTVLRAIANLAEAGHLEIVRRTQHGNRYRIPRCDTDVTPQGCDRDVACDTDVTANVPKSAREMRHPRHTNKKQEQHPTTRNTPARADEVFRAFCEVAEAAGLSVPRSLTPARRKKLKTRLADPAWPWREALVKLAASSFCRGDSDGGWKADLDWFLKPDSAVRLIEGKYDGRAGNGRPIFDATTVSIR